MAGPLEERFRSVRDLLPEYRVETARGRIVVNESGTWQHNTLVFQMVCRLIGAAVERGWEIWPNITVYLGRNADRYVPDLAVVPHRPRMWREHAVYGDATVLLVDIVTAGSVYEDYHVKPGEYARAGVPLYLLVDPQECTVKLFGRPEGGKYGTEMLVAGAEPLILPAPWELAVETRELW
ncbi:Uma2 family endonuclease [Nonomuraea fuscirosea]|uniref:Uma2 family endonuclease n=1 Tax=Nonomuraea fuscirosea TaxID=1291556 RepID=UPI00342911CB